LSEKPQGSFEKVYLVMNVQGQLPDPKTGKTFINLQLYDESSTPQPGMIKGVTFAMHEDEYKALGSPTPPQKLKVTITRLP
jgi:hypothetical protein